MAFQSSVITSHLTDDTPVGCFDKAIFVYACKRCQTADQTDVWTFRGFDRANATIRGVVDIADIEASAFPPQPTRAEGGKGALMAQLGQRIGLIHELRELAGAKELAQRRHHWTNIYQGYRGKLLLIANGHAFLDDTLHAAQTNAQLVLNQFTDGLNAPVAEMVNIIRRFHAIINEDHPPQQANNVCFGHRTVRDGDLQVEFLIQFIAAHAFQIIMALIEQLLVEKSARIIEGGRVAGTHALEELDQGCFGNRQSTGKIPFWFLAQC